MSQRTRDSTVNKRVYPSRMSCHLSRRSYFSFFMRQITRDVTWVGGCESYRVSFSTEILFLLTCKFLKGKCDVKQCPLRFEE